MTKHAVKAMAFVAVAGMLVGVAPVLAENVSSTMTVVPVTSKLGVATPTLYVKKEKETKQQTFCKAISEWQVKLDKKAAEMTDKWDQALVNRNEKIADARHDATEKLYDLRGKHDDEREKGYEKRMGKATTDAQKAAITKYQTAVEAAVVIRKAAIDKSIADYRAGVDASLLARRTALKTAMDKYLAAVKVIEAKAVADCTANVTSSKVRMEVGDAMKEAREAYLADRKLAPTVSEKNSKLIEARKAAHETAFAAFHKAVEAAKVELRAAFQKLAKEMKEIRKEEKKEWEIKKEERKEEMENKLKEKSEHRPEGTATGTVK